MFLNFQTEKDQFRRRYLELLVNKETEHHQIIKQYPMRYYFFPRKSVILYVASPILRLPIQEP